MSCHQAETLDPRVRRTRRLLEDAFKALMHEKALTSISVQDIAERATVNRATFYAHFVDKQALMASVLVRDLEEWMSERLPLGAPFNPENLLIVTEAVFDFLGNVCGHCPKAAHEMENFFGATIQEWLYEFVFCWIQDAPRPASLKSHSKETIATVLSWSIFGGAYRWSRGARKHSAREVSGQLVGMLLPG